MILRFELPTLQRKDDALDFIQEHVSHKSNINGSGGLDRFLDKYDEWVDIIIKEHNGEVVREKYVPSSTYFVVDEHKRIVGMVNIRHELSQLIIDNGWGHIGYGVRPSERRKGYATEILRLALLECKNLGIEKVLVGCMRDNIASKKVILKNGGFLQEVIQTEEGEDLVFWINNK